MKKLSICIPTYNRSKTLGMTLESVIGQAKGLEEYVEICVSNNCSTDETEEVVEEYKKYFPIHYHKMEVNVGHLPNWDYMIREQALGQYVMLLGDDDIMINDSIRKILEVINRSPYDYVYLNHCYKSIQEMREIVRKNGIYQTYKEECECYDFETHPIDKWEKILNIKGRNQENNMVYMGSHLFKKEVWKPFKYNPMFLFEDNPAPLSENTLSYYFQVFCGHSHIIAKNMMGKGCYYLGEPLVIQSLSTQDVNATFPILYLATVSMHMKKLKEYGMDENEFIKYKEFVDGHVIKRFTNLMINRKEKIEEYPLVKKYLCENIGEKGFLERMFQCFSDFSNQHSVKIALGIMEQQIKKTLKENKEQGKVVLWGTGDVAKSLLDASKELRKAIDMVVDSNILRQGRNYEKINKKIESPDRLTGERISIVVISSIKYELDIIKYLQEHINQHIIVIAASGIFEI